MANCLKCLSKHQQLRESSNCSRKTSHSLSANRSIRASDQLLETSNCQLSKAWRFPEGGTVADRTCSNLQPIGAVIKQRSRSSLRVFPSGRFANERQRRLRFTEGENIPDSSPVSHSVDDTRLGVLQSGRLFAKDDLVG